MYRPCSLSLSYLYTFIVITIIKREEEEEERGRERERENMPVCSLNLSPPSPTSIPTTSLPSKTTSVAWPSKERSWSSQCVVGVACMIMGIEMSNLIMVNQERAIAHDMQLLVQSNDQVKRWSEKRTCQPWRVNSLETIVPENLPRPSARRRWESVGHTRLAPALKVTILETNPKCFSM